MAGLRKKWIVVIIFCSTVLFFWLPGAYLRLPNIAYKPLRSDDSRKIRATSYSDSRTIAHGTKGKAKPWPEVPSFLPWRLIRDLTPHSCEGYFGNGFTNPINVLDRKDSFISDKKGSKPEEPSLRCLFSDTLRTSICEGRKVVMHPGRIQMSDGGEPLDSVIGRSDPDELPSFSPGAFEIVSPPQRSGTRTGDVVADESFIDVILPQGQIHDHRLRSLFSNMRFVSSDEVSCTQKVKDSTLLVIRYEYANLFHTATDWYSAYSASRVLDLPHSPNVVLVDGHCQSPMDDGWEALFSNVKYAKNFSGPVCFDHVIFTPLGYETAMFKGLNSGIPCKGCPASELNRIEDSSKTARLREFGEVFKALLGVVNKRASNVINVLLIRREDYLAHPRHRGKPEVRLHNEVELLGKMQKWAKLQSQRFDVMQKKMSINVIDGTFAHMNMKQQVQAVHDASIIVGVHGAGLSHILFSQPGTAILELLGPQFLRPHYSHISQWMGQEYQSISMTGTVANIPEVLDQLTSMLNKLL